MAYETHSDAGAPGILGGLSEDEFIRLSKNQVETLVDAIKEDLDTLARKEMEDEDRLARVERQIRVLSEAVLAITDRSDVLAPAARAVKAAM